MRALPVEFVEILESVPTVEVQDNPWTYLPEKWGRLRPGKHVSEAPFGYSLPDTLNFLYSMRLIYDCVEQMWAEFGVFYYTGRFSYQDYLQEIRQRIPNTWHEGLQEFAQHLFFKSRETGIFVRWYELNPEQETDLMKKQQMAMNRHEASVQKARDDESRRFYKSQQAYKQDIYRRMRQASDQLTEHARGEEHIETMQAHALHSQLYKTGKKMARVHSKRETAIADKEHQEATRMLDVLREDKPNRDAEREYIRSLHLEEVERAALLADAAPVVIANNADVRNNSKLPALTSSQSDSHLSLVKVNAAEPKSSNGKVVRIKSPVEKKL